MNNFFSLPNCVNVTITKNELVEAIKFYAKNKNNENRVNYPEYLTIQQLSSYLSYSKPALYKMVGNSSIPYYKLQSKLLFKRSEIDSWLLDFRQPTINEFIATQEAQSK